MNAFQKLLKEKYLNIQAKLVFPLAATILVLVLLLSPLSNLIINRRIEQEADRRLGQIADSVGALIENSEVLARNNAALLAKQPEVENVFMSNSTGDSLEQTREDLGLQELSLYTKNFTRGDQPLYYGGPSITRRLQVSEDALRIREDLIIAALESESPQSNVAISSQSSQIIGAAPVYNPQTNQITGVVLTAYYMDQAYIENISQTIDTDIAIVKDNLTVVSTIDTASGYERLINEGWLNSADVPAENVNYSDGTQYRLLSDPLMIMGNQQGSVLVAQPVDDLFSLSQSIQLVLFTVTGVFAITALWFWIAAFLTFTRPLVQLTDATSNISQGDFNQQVNVSYLMFKDEITLLSENFNSMTNHLNELYT